MRFIILGAGDVGTTLASQLVKAKHDIVLIDIDEARLSSASAQFDLQVVPGNGCSPDILVHAGLNTADYFIAVADNDEVNIAACLIAKLVNPLAKRIARVREISLNHKEIAFAQVEGFFDLIVNPTQAAVDYLMRMFRVVGARDVIDFCDGKLQVVALDVKPNSPFVGKKLSTLRDLKDRLDTLIIAVIRDGELIVPRGSDALHKDDTIYCITRPNMLSTLFELVGSTFTAAKTAMVWGAGNLGRLLVRHLEEQGTNVKFIVGNDPALAGILDEFQNILVLEGDGKDKSLLLEENIEDVDAFFAVTQDHEDNILSSLLAKKLGARTSMALVNKATYLPLVHAIGVDVVVSSRAAAASAIFSHIHSDSLVSEFSLRHLGAGFIEVEIEESMPLSGKSISEMKIPHGAIFAAVNRGEDIIIPSGDTVVETGDSLVVFVTKGVQSKLERLFSKKLEFIV